jgi:hypothetical protein
VRGIEDGYAALATLDEVGTADRTAAAPSGLLTLMKGTLACCSDLESFYDVSGR